jgi:hypothetical protein
MNVYLRPLVEELKKLWTDGVRVTDMSSSHINRRTYVTKAVLMWTMHDYPGYGIASSLQTQGYHACPPCGPVEVPAYSTEFLGKIIYHGHRKFLVRGHKWRARRYNALWGGYDEESKEPPKRWTGYEWLAMWTQVEEGMVPLATSGMKGLSIFFELDYWAVSTLQSHFSPNIYKLF